MSFSGVEILSGYVLVLLTFLGVPSLFKQDLSIECPLSTANYGQQLLR